MSDSTETETLTLTRLLRTAIDYHLVDVHTTLPGHIVKANGSVVDVQIDIQRTMITGEHLTIPELEDVPVIFPRSAGGNAYLQMPLQVGDYGLVIFCERNIDDWKDDGKIGPPSGEDLRKFDYSDAVFLPGLYPINKALKPTASLIVKNKNSQLELRPDGKMTLGNPGADVVSIISDFLDIIYDMQDIVTPSGPGSTGPATKILIQLLQQKIATLKA